MRGARWAQDEFLPQHPDPDLRVYVVWVMPLGMDATPDVLNDPRVQHFRDKEKIAGKWFATFNGRSGVIWDVYYVFSSDARWDDGPSPIQLSGSLVINDTEAIIAAVESALSQ
jgi:hypothetical protein